MGAKTNRGLDAIADHPALATAVGALGVSTSGLFIALCATSPGTASFFRCLFALPLLAPLTFAEWRWSAIGWLVLTAICGQVLGWLLVAVGSPLLRAEVGSALLLLTPVGALALGLVFLAQVPTVLQGIGCLVILASAYLITANREARATGS